MKRPRLRRALGVTATTALALGWWSALALACPLCSADKGDSLRSYYGATLLLSVVPLAIFGSIALWLRRAARRAAEHAKRPSAVP